MKIIETIIIGGGQAGLATSYHLKQAGREHIIFDAAEKPAHAWRTDRWDSFTFVTPNWTIQLPGAHYDGNDPDGFLTKDEIVAYFERYVGKFDLPVQYNTTVLEVTPLESGKGYQVRTDAENYQAKNVVVATGSFQKPKIPAFSANIPLTVQQLHSGKYRNPHQLPDGAVLVVGSGQSGLQIAEELYQSGRKVYLSAGFAPRIPRRYRGRDIFAWLTDTGFFEQTPDKLPSPKARFGANPQLSGKDGGHTLNLHQFVRDGVILLGHIDGIYGGNILFKPDFKETLSKIDKAEKDIIAMIDKYIESKGIAAPQETVPELQDGYSVEAITELNFQSANICTVIWAMGYTFDYSFVKLPVTDEDGFPIQKRGVTHYPGLYFVGMNWLSKRKSAILLGVDEDAESIAAEIKRTSL
ncbi:MAG: NAD(P)-binding domain-containing protein [Anaerolineales bacterium]